MIASCGPEVKVHEWPTGKTLFSISPKNNADKYNSISWSAKGQRLLAIPLADKPVLLTSYQYKNDISFNTDVLAVPLEATVVAFSRKSEGKAVFATAKGDVAVIDVSTLEIVKRLQSITSSVAFMDYSYKDILLAVGSKCGQVYIYNTTGTARSDFYVPWSYTLSAMMCHPSRENLLAAASREGVLAIWDIYSNTVKFAVKNHAGPVTGIAISASEELLTSVGLDKKINIYDLRTKETVFSRNLSAELSAVACDPMGQDFAVATTTGRILIIDKRQPSYTKGSFASQKGAIKNVSFDSSTLDDRSMHNLQTKLSNPILPDDPSSSSAFSESEPKTKASGDFSADDDESSRSRIPPVDSGVVVPQSPQPWPRPRPATATSLIYVAPDPNLAIIKQELMNISSDITQKFMEDITNQFLQVRMGVGREFCHMESSNDKRWRQFNKTLLNLAGYDEPKKELDALSRITNVSDDMETQRASIYTKTRVSNYSQRKVPTIKESEREGSL